MEHRLNFGTFWAYSPIAPAQSFAVQHTHTLKESNESKTDRKSEPFFSVAFNGFDGVCTQCTILGLRKNHRENSINWKLHKQTSKQSKMKQKKLVAHSLKIKTYRDWDWLALFGHLLAWIMHHRCLFHSLARSLIYGVERDNQLCKWIDFWMVTDPTK